MDPLWWIAVGLGLIAVGSLFGYGLGQNLLPDVPPQAVIIGGVMGTLLGFIGLVGLTGLILYPVSTLVLGLGIGGALRRRRKGAG